MKILLIALMVLSANTQDQLPEGDGKQLVLKVCNDCHGTETYTDKKRTKEQWEKVIQSMAEKGAEASESEFDKIVAYLTKNFGKTE